MGVIGPIAQSVEEICSMSLCRKPIPRAQPPHLVDPEGRRPKNYVITIETLRKKREAVLQIANRYGATDIRIFRSLARGDTTEHSDLDLIVRFEPGLSLFDHGGLIMDLQDLLGVRVDVISEAGMSDRFREHVAAEAIPL